MLSKIKKLFQFHVHRWHYAMGGWHEKDVRLIAVLEDDVWYWALINYLSWDWLTRICSWLHYVPLPWFIRNWERHWDKDDPEYFAKFEDWYGDDFGCLWHGYVEDPICQWAWRHRDAGHDIYIELTLDEARKKFGAEHEAVKWIEKELAEHKQYDAEKLDEIRKAFAAGELTREQALEKLEWHFDDENLDALLDGKAELAVS
jgi:hypothetical protein